MRSPVRLSCALGLALLWPSSGWSAPKTKSTTGADSKKSAAEISADDGFQKQMDWENQVLGPNTTKKIDLAKIQKLQAEETARREKQEKLDKVDRERKEREAALAAQRQDVKAPSSREVPSVEEAPPPPKPAEKHDDAFVDKLLKSDGKPSKRVAVSNDDVDELLDKAKQDKAASIAPKPTKGGRTDSVDQLLATADQQQAIKTTVRKPAEAEPVSAEAAAREATLKAIAAANARAEEERSHNRRPAIPDAAMLQARRQQAAPTAQAAHQPEIAARDTPESAPAAREAPAAVAPSAAPAVKSSTWQDPFANEAAPSPRRTKLSATKLSTSKISATVVPRSSRARHGAVGRHAPSTRPAGDDSAQDPFEGGGATKARPASPKVKSHKRSAHWKDPFA
jgi:hypothetical protein